MTLRGKEPTELVIDGEKVVDQLNLEKPVRIVEFTIGGVKVRIPRGADDKTPDDVLRIGGIPVKVR